jgi:hypothetical protein
VHKEGSSGMKEMNGDGKSDKRDLKSLDWSRKYESLEFVNL